MKHENRPAETCDSQNWKIPLTSDNDETLNNLQEFTLDPEQRDPSSSSHFIEEQSVTIPRLGLVVAMTVTLSLHDHSLGHKTFLHHYGQ